jgi:uncharacterized protein with PQ loop repeat
MSFNFFLILNSLLLIVLIISQNESTKEITATQTSLMNPFEKGTWVSFILQFVLLLIKIKGNDF